MRRACDRGAAVVWVLVCAAALFAVATVVVVRTLAVLARHRAETAADLAALAAAGRIGIGGDPCEVAGRVARANAARLTACTVDLDPDGRSGTVTVLVRVVARLPAVGDTGVVTGARAGRLPAAFAASG